VQSTNERIAPWALGWDDCAFWFLEILIQPALHLAAWTFRRRLCLRSVSHAKRVCLSFSQKREARGARGGLTTADLISSPERADAFPFHSNWRDQGWLMPSGFSAEWNI